MCIEGWAHYMEVAGWESHIEDGNLDTLIGRRSIRAGALEWLREQEAKDDLLVQAKLALCPWWPAHRPDRMPIREP